jgi:hypothetical protein
LTILESANPDSNNNHLKGVASLSSNDVWAVGFYTDNAAGTFNTLAMHWNGSAWTITPTPNPSSSTNQLKKVVALTTNDVWAVGGHGRSYTLRWNGAAWSQVPLPPINNRGFTDVTNYLEDIAAVGSNDIWMVGSVDALNGGTWTLTMHWNGTQWTQIPSPNVPMPSGGFYSQGLDSVVALAANNVWAVGYYRVGNVQHTLILHWNGTQWSIVPSPDGPTGNGWLHGIAAAGPNDIWAVGEYDKADFTSPGKALALHWDGVSWSAFVPPNPSPFGINPLHSVIARGSSDFYAVGEWEISSQGLNTYVVHWDGTAWSQTSSENPPGSGTGWNQLHDVARDNSGGLWTVGKKQASFGSPNYTLVQRANLGAAPLAMTGVFSRKVQGAAGTFDIELPAGESTGVECRTGGVNAEHTIVFTFANPLASVGGASVTSGTGTITSSAIGADAREYMVNLKGVANAQEITVTLTNVTDSLGDNGASVQAKMAVLAGDTNASRAVNSSDIGQVKARSGQAVTPSSFRSDVNASGSINSSDISLIKSRSGTSIP